MTYAIITTCFVRLREKLIVVSISYSVQYILERGISVSFVKGVYWVCLNRSKIFVRTINFALSVKILLVAAP